jgi:hypothetical protein
VTRVRFVHDIDDLASDLVTIAAKVKVEAPVVIAKNVADGERIAQGIARANSGIHGLRAYKRITSEMTAPLSGVFGYTGDVRSIVGAGWRHGDNTDIPKAGDIVGPKFAKDAGDLLDGLFWPR